MVSVKEIEIVEEDLLGRQLDGFHPVDIGVRMPGVHEKEVTYSRCSEELQPPENGVYFRGILFRWLAKGRWGG